MEEQSLTKGIETVSVAQSLEGNGDIQARIDRGMHALNVAAHASFVVSAAVENAASTVASAVAAAAALALPAAIQPAAIKTTELVKTDTTKESGEKITPSIAAAAEVSSGVKATKDKTNTSTNVAVSSATMKTEMLASAKPAATEVVVRREGKSKAAEKSIESAPAHAKVAVPQLLLQPVVASNIAAHPVPVVLHTDSDDGGGLYQLSDISDDQKRLKVLYFCVVVLLFIFMLYILLLFVFSSHREAPRR